MEIFSEEVCWIQSPVDCLSTSGSDALSVTKIISYEGSGYMDEKSLTIMLDLGNKKLIMTGKPTEEGEDNL